MYTRKDAKNWISILMLLSEALSSLHVFLDSLDDAVAMHWMRFAPSRCLISLGSWAGLKPDHVLA